MQRRLVTLGVCFGGRPVRLLSAKEFVVLLGLFWATIGAGQNSAGTNAPARMGEPYLILISIDGFRWDYQRRHDTPALDRIAGDGVAADALVPVFPTLTFPNHYSIATGLYPVNHGLVGNRFPSEDRRRFFDLGDRASVEDGSWYRGEPIWVAAERAGIISAAYFFVGTEAAVGGVRPTYWKPYNSAVSGARLPILHNGSQIRVQPTSISRRKSGIKSSTAQPSGRHRKLITEANGVKKGKENMSVRKTLSNQKRKRNLSLNIRNNLPNAGATR